MMIETRGLTKRFDDVLAVDNLNLTVRDGEIYGFLGPNGAGKTTTLKLLLGLLYPTAGKVYINGTLITPDTVDIKERIGYLPERVSFYPNLTPVQTLRFFCRLKGADPSVVPELLREVGLEDAANRRVGTFSKGMTQLLGFAQAMIGAPDIYILDEPASGLDARWVKSIRDRIKSLNEGGATVLFSSHILTEVEALSHRVGIINRGRLIAEDTLENLRKKLDLKPRLWLRLKNEVPENLENIKGVESVDVQDMEVILTCSPEMKFHVIEEVNRMGGEVEDFRTIEPSLEEAFVKLLEEKHEAE